MLFHQLRSFPFVEMLSSCCSGKRFPRVCRGADFNGILNFDPVAAATGCVPCRSFECDLCFTCQFMLWVSFGFCTLVLCAVPPSCDDLLSFNGLRTYRCLFSG